MPAKEAAAALSRKGDQLSHHSDELIRHSLALREHSNTLVGRRTVATPAEPQSSRLTSWKQIAVYLGKGIRTVQRWEQSAAMPVRRPRHNAILAFSDELDRWVRNGVLRQHGSGPPQIDTAAHEGPDDFALAVSTVRQLRRDQRELREAGCTLREAVRQERDRARTLVETALKLLRASNCHLSPRLPGT